MSINQCVNKTVVRKLGDSNPRYGNPYGSLANCWFQPLTQTSSVFPFRATDRHFL